MRILAEYNNPRGIVKQSGYTKKWGNFSQGFTLVEVVAVMALLGAGIVTMIIFFGPAARLFVSGRQRMLMQQDADYALSAINLNIREARSIEIPTDNVLVLTEVENSNTYTHRYYRDTNLNRLIHRDRNGETTVLLPLSSLYQISGLTFNQVYTLRGASTNLTLQRLYQGSPEETMIATTTAISRFN